MPDLLQQRIEALLVEFAVRLEVGVGSNARDERLVGKRETQLLGMGFDGGAG